MKFNNKGRKSKLFTEYEVQDLQVIEVVLSVEKLPQPPIKRRIRKARLRNFWKEPDDFEETQTDQKLMENYLLWTKSWAHNSNSVVCPSPLAPHSPYDLPPSHRLSEPIPANTQKMSFLGFQPVIQPGKFKIL